MSNLTQETDRGPSPGPPVTPELLARVQDALAALGVDHSFGPGSANGQATTALMRATRETLRSFEEARTASDESAFGRAAGYRSLLHRILDAASKRSVRLAFHNSPFAIEWTALLLDAVQASDYTVGTVFFSRARELGDRTLFLLPPNREEARISWREARSRVVEIGRSLLALRRREGIAPIAMLSSNSPELALFDLACLVTGTPNVPIPANSPGEVIDLIRRHSGARSFFIGEESLADAARPTLLAEPHLGRIHWLDDKRQASGEIRSFRSFLEAGAGVPESEVLEAASLVHSGGLATTMYTSGTTGMPKAVPFTQANLVAKRFARAAAWPDLGEGDVFLCYLPLYHTFGRWLELLGCVFWGSVYAFLEDVSVESMLYAFHRVRPTTFISVPKKWIQIAEAVAPLTEESEDPSRIKEISQALVATTGGRLRRGLSAAGHLPSWVFRRFHAAGIELHSGFGMTEATGGITMTPAGDYRDDSIGTALPGIELRVAGDGELLIRGPYVTAPGPDDPPREGGWFATGDIVTVDRDGHLRIIDRKKEIFKNVQGETISPRRIESLFADFDVVERVLVIGDGLDYCTVLIVPSAELRERYGRAASDATLDSPELREIFAPIVATVNRFLAPYERLVDFAILSRDLDPELGELTAKGTPKRKLVHDRFDEAIRPMYSREEKTFQVGDLRVRLPLWFFRHSGIPTHQIRATENRLEIATSGRRLEIRRVPGASAAVQVGEAVYDPGGEELLLGHIFGRAELWLGNDAVVKFIGPGIEQWWRRGRRFKVPTRVRYRIQAKGTPPPRVSDLPAEADTGLARLHQLARVLTHPEAAERRSAIEALRALRTATQEIQELARAILFTSLSDPDVRAEALLALIASLAPEELDPIFLEHLCDPNFLSEREISLIASQPLREDQLEVLNQRVADLARSLGSASGQDTRLPRLLDYLIEQGARNASNHLKIRAVFVTLRDEVPALSIQFDQRLNALSQRFQAALPPLVTREGVTWEEAVVFRGAIPPERETRIRQALAKTRLLPEALHLFTGGPEQPLEPLGPRSVRVTFLGRGTGRAVHLLEWAPGDLDREEAAFECILKVNRDLAWRDIETEIRLLIRARTDALGRPVVKAQGGRYPEYGTWTEEFVPGETLDHLVDRLTAEKPREGTDDADRLSEYWQFLVSSSASLIVEFWNRTGRQLSLRNPTAEKIVLPAHDWQIGRRLVSIADLAPYPRVMDVLTSIHFGIVEGLRSRFPEAAPAQEWPIVLSAALEVLGEEEGLALLEEEAKDLHGEVADTVQRFLSSVRRRGFLPVRIRIAARRYRRWANLNSGATLEARATTLDQIEVAYGLDDLDLERPGSRLQFYRHTVFRGADDDFTQELDDIIARTLSEKPTKADWHRWVTTLREKLAASDEQEFFLARMLYPHLDPRGRAVLVHEEESAEGFATGVVVEQRDSEGEIFRIRRPANPNEVSALFREFHRANFRRVPSAAQENLLVVTDESGRVIGGLVSRKISETYVRLEWLVISRHRRGRGIGSALLKEWMERLTTQGVRAVSTGFFRPAFFTTFGFGVDPRYAGLVRMLKPSSGIHGPEGVPSPETSDSPKSGM
jgi:long-subunit acyl-CoA synthetase (AMP-forming)/predicted N-acetyltransferase YhbS